MDPGRENFSFTMQRDVPPPKPPDGRGGGNLWNNGSTTFRDKVLGVRTSQESGVQNLLQQGLMTLDHVDGNRLFPKFTIDPQEYARICQPWQDCLVVKVLGRSVGYLYMREKLKAIWKPSGGFELIDISNGYYLVKFDIIVDRDSVINGGPWMLYDHYLTVRPWSPEFVAAHAKIEKTLVWIRLPSLGLQYYDESILLTIASAVGKPIKVDINTRDMARGRFARVCVEIDLSIPVVGKYWLNGAWYTIEYEGLHLLCANCGCYGHVARNCANPTNSAPAAEPSKDDGLTAEGAPGNRGTNPPQDQIAEIAAKESVSKEDNISIPSNPHGDWLVVQRRKKKATETRYSQ